MQHGVFEILFSYNAIDFPILYEVSATYDPKLKELNVLYVYNLEKADYEDVEIWEERVWNIFQWEIIDNLKNPNSIRELGFYN